MTWAPQALAAGWAIVRRAVAAACLLALLFGCSIAVVLGSGRG